MVVFITKHGIPITQAKMALSHKARITQVFEKVVKNKLSHKLLKKIIFYRNSSRIGYQFQIQKIQNIYYSESNIYSESS